MPKRLVCPDSGKRMTASQLTIAVSCPACGQYVRLRKDGRLMKHAPPPQDHGAAVNQRLQQTADAIRDWKKGQR